MTYHLVQAILPRGTPPPGRNRFAFPAVAKFRVRPQVGAAAEQMCDEAWALVGTLSVIALTKNRHITRAVWWLVVMTVTSMLWLTVLIVLG